MWCLKNPLLALPWFSKSTSVEKSWSELIRNNRDFADVKKILSNRTRYMCVLLVWVPVNQQFHWGLHLTKCNCSLLHSLHNGLPLCCMLKGTWLPKKRKKKKDWGQLWNWACPEQLRSNTSLTLVIVTIHHWLASFTVHTLFYRLTVITITSRSRNNCTSHSHNLQSKEW